MKKPTFFKPFLFVLISSVALASMPKLTFAQRGGGGLRGGGGFRSGSVGGFRGGFRGGAPAHMGGVPSWHPGGSGFAPRGPAFSRRDIGGGRAGVARPPMRFERQVQDANRPPSAHFERHLQSGDSGPAPGPRAASPREVHSSSPNNRSPSTIARNSRNTGMLSQSLSRSANASVSAGSHSIISANRGPTKFSHFGTTQLGTSASTITGSRFGANAALFTGTRFVNPFENRFRSLTFGRTGFGGAGINRFDPNISHVFNSNFRFDQFGFNRFAFNNFFFDRFFFFNQFGFFPARDFFFFPQRNFFFFDFAFFPRFGFFEPLPWWWGQGWWGPGWGWPSPPPTLLGF